jgi:hypothetical protein
MAALIALTIAGFGYFCGAAVMFFELPSCDFLNKAFAGAEAWYERGRPTISVSPGEPGEGRPAKVTVDEAEKTYDGFTLYVTTEGTRATLLDMRAKVVHRWRLPFSRAWPQAPHVEDPLPDERIHWFHCYLYPNGDLLAIYHADGDTPYGYGLVKLDKDSKLLWAYAGRVHHDLDVAEDGTIYTLAQNVIHEPPAGLEFLPTPSLTDSLVVLSAEGRELETIPLLDAFAQSPYAPILDSITKHPATSDPGVDRPRTRTISKSDMLHTNSVKVLSRALAPKFPQFKAGQVLLSVRNLDTVAILDRPTRRVVWAAQGIWRVQHDADFLDNGHLLLYDNLGSMRRGTRILEYDPLTQAIPWHYGNERSLPFAAQFRGVKQRLPNGNTLIIDPDRRRLFEVTHDKELAWECVLPPFDSHGLPRKGHAVNGSRRYGADELTFLKGVARARP